MDFILIYGPPATGKLTVANKLAKIIGYKLFHNQLTVDLVGSLFPWGTKEHQKYNNKFRIELIEAAAKSKKVKGIIFTFCYAHPEDVNFVKLLKKKVEKHNGKFHLVQLTCHKEQLFKRVKEASRENFDKLKTKKGLKKVLEKYDLYSPVPKLHSLKVNNSKTSAVNVAKKIKEHYNL